MLDSVSTQLKTETDSVKDNPPSKFKQNFMQNNQRFLNTKKLTYSNKKIAISNQKDAWKQMFGNFLHDINLKQKKDHTSKEAKEHLQDPLVNEVPIFLPCSNKQFKLQFYKYLEGEQSINELLKAIRFPRLEAIQLDDQKKQRRKLSIVQKIKKMKANELSKTTDKAPQLDVGGSTKQLKAQQLRLIDQRRFTEAGKLMELYQIKINNKVQVLRDFIQQRIKLRQQLNKEQREEEIRNIHFIKTFFDITNDYNQHILDQQEELQDDAQYYKKLVPCQKKLKQLLVNYDNVQPIIRHQEKHFDRFDYPSLGMLKNQMNQYSKDYLVELEQQKQIQFKTALNQVRKLLEQQNIKFQSELRKSKIKSNQNSKSQSPLNLHNQDSQNLINSLSDCPLDVIVTSPKRNINSYKSYSQLKSSIADPIKRKDYVITKKPFYLFTKQADGDKNSKNTKGLITNFDVKLYDYIHNRNIYTLNKQVQQNTQKFHTLIESQQEQQLNEQLDTQLNQLRKKRLKLRQHGSLEAQRRIKTEKQQDEISDDQSLQSIYEVNLDVYYDQSNQLSKKLREKGDIGFAKRIKQLIRLEEVNTQCLRTNIQKLNKSQSSLNK
ncbi:unnamed protein product (macronuclear) [Paramecium tetraurelia]|uniref:Uncharacterized protein n=1 Tax=Paramecium tetraurelia TaxID=5888 RepID=A0CWL8_PARTE|nr:uncharacterized protein GSPATT00001388001 [Paramecium tetraurelia]CAK75185.1 unnamed protein product [Paramecium tetraurelia]|eukprot:XP_001442582.1 hypothetical protein (macronuclear) [Paramecium tetraurelia strain d4-2]